MIERNTIEVNELKKMQVEILDVFCEYCETHKLKYYLAYGTLIGAIRHKGYIPWDDDIDVMMPRDDYEILINRFNTNSQSEKIAVLSHANDTEYYLPFAKVVNINTVMKEEINSDYEIGVYIDVFPLDNLGDEYKTANRLIKKAFRYNELLSLKNLTTSKHRTWYKNAVLYIGRLAAMCLSRHMIIERINSIGIRGGAEGKYLGMLTGLYHRNDCKVLQLTWFKDSLKVEFERKLYFVPEGYDELLRTQYGDYMKLPPSEQQNSHHVFEAWYK